MSEQVGGDHYASEFQHWDLIELHGVGYLEGCATKYLCRWQKKNGVEDLRKALSYVEKLKDLHLLNGRPPRGFIPKVTLDIFFSLNLHLREEDRTIIAILCRWEAIQHLQHAIRSIEKLIKDALQDAG